MADRAYVEAVPFTSEGLAELIGRLAPAGTDRAPSAKYLLDFPTVYVAHHQVTGKYKVYVGETSDIRGRTLQHLTGDTRVREDWAEMSASEAEMYVVGHTKFNKSLTLDIENRLMLYLTGASDVIELNNRRSNPQNDYYTRQDFDKVFSQIWRKLRKHNKELFPTESVVRDSALFKASPFHKLTRQQMAAKNEILGLIHAALQSGDIGQLILIKGAAGAGKTVLLSSLFYELFQGADEDDPFDYQSVDSYLLVNHLQQLTVYQQIARKLTVMRRGENRVTRPTTFINNHDPARPVDVVLVDEAHLLWTQGKQSYRGRNMLPDLLKRAKVVVAVFDEAQILLTNQYLEPDQIEAIENRASRVMELGEQMRIESSEETLGWIRAVIDDGVIRNIPSDAGYEIKIFDSPVDLHAAVKNQASDLERGLSRLLATFDWPYSESRRADGHHWEVTVGDLRLPWNLEISVDKATKRKNGGLAWAEQAHTVDEVGSTFTIQGFDLNYAGVILGPSIKYREGRVVIDPTASANKGATQNRTLRDGSKKRVGETLIRNELNVLLTRGVNGLYIYAVDEQLRDALLKAQEGLLDV